MRKLCHRQWNWQAKLTKCEPHSWDPRQRTTWSRLVTSDFNSVYENEDRMCLYPLLPHTLKTFFDMTDANWCIFSTCSTAKKSRQLNNFQVRKFNTDSFTSKKDIDSIKPHKHGMGVLRCSKHEIKRLHILYSLYTLKTVFVIEPPPPPPPSVTGACCWVFWPVGHQIHAEANQVLSWRSDIIYQWRI